MKKPTITAFAALMLLSSGCGERLQSPLTLPLSGVSLAPNLGFRVQSTIPSPTLDWLREFGTPNEDYPQGVTIDSSGNAYVMGNTYGTFPGQTNAGGIDAFVQKYDAGGNVIWTSQLGTSKNEGARGVSVDSNGCVYLVGSIGDYYSNVVDAFVRKCDSSGKEIWTRQFGTENLTYAQGVAADSSGNVFVIGNTYGGQANIGVVDAFIRMFSPSGEEIWSKQFGTSNADYAQSLAVDVSGNVYVVGKTYGTLPGQTRQGEYDAFLRKYDTSGNELWTRQFGTANDENVFGLAIDSTGNVYVTGNTFGNFPGYGIPSNIDVFVRKYDACGNELWTRQFGTPVGDNIQSISVDSSGNSYTTGYNHSTAGDSNIFVRMYSARGKEVWSHQLGTPKNEEARGISVDSNGNAYVTGYTQGTLSEQTNAGSWDGFLAKISTENLMTIAVDIKPGDSQNTIKLNSKGKLTFAILSTAMIDATQFDPQTVTLAGAKATKWSQKDLNGDGLTDLLLQAKIKELQLTPEDTMAIIKGTTYDGKAFEASDTVHVMN